MRTFTKPVPVTVAIEWLEKGRENLYSALDVGKQNVPKIGSLQAVEAYIKSQRPAKRETLRLMTYRDLKDFHRKAAPIPAAAPTPAADGGFVGVKLPHQAAYEAAIVGKEQSPRTASAKVAPEPPAANAPAGVSGLTVDLLQSIINERVKAELSQHNQHRAPINLSKEGQDLIARIRQFETQGLELLAELEQTDHDEIWTNTAAVQFGQATMAMVKSLVEAADKEPA